MISRSYKSKDVNYYRSSLRARHAEFAHAWADLDRIQILGDGTYDNGHTGCVNALSWSTDGRILVSSGDDQRLCLWSNDGIDFKQHTAIETGHTANVFSAHFLPSSYQIATCAGDKQVRVFDVSRMGTTSDPLHTTWRDNPSPCTNVLRCHRSRVKKVLTEEGSPSTFLTVSEDRTVRSHDLRVPHRCTIDAERSSCPEPLLVMPHRLSALTSTPLRPWLFAVAGEMQHGYLFDRRMSHRRLHEEWGCGPDNGNAMSGRPVNCVRRFGRSSRGPGEPKGGEHVTGARMSAHNGHELLLSYHHDAVYLYSIYDSPLDLDSIRRPHPGGFRSSESKRQGLSEFDHGGHHPSQPTIAPPTKRRRRFREDSPTIGEHGYVSNAESTNESRGIGTLREDVHPSISSLSRSSPPSILAAPPHDGVHLVAAGAGGHTDRISPSPTPSSENPRNLLSRNPVSSASLPRSRLARVDDTTERDGLEVVLASERGMTDESDEPEEEEERFAELEENADGVMRAMELLVSDEEEVSEPDESYVESDVEEDGAGEQDESEGDGDYLEVDDDDDGPKDDPQWLTRDVVYPRGRYSGVCNVDTVKDVNFLGPYDQYVVSGSDDGTWFMWEKSTSRVVGIWEGDNDVVNVIEAHPTLPLVACSGIDNTVKLFAPDKSWPEREDVEHKSARRIHDLDEIIAENSDQRRRLMRGRQMRLEELALHLGVPPERLLDGDCVIS